MLPKMCADFLNDGAHLIGEGGLSVPARRCAEVAELTGCAVLADQHLAGAERDHALFENPPMDAARGAFEVRHHPHIL